MSMIAIWEVVLLFALGLVSVPMPLSVPPLPEDQNLLRSAPADSVAYFSWFGRAKANPNSQNRTERLAAEPQVRGMVLTVAKALREAWVAEADDEAQLATECFNLLTLIGERPGCLFLAGVDVPPQPFTVRAGLVAHLGPGAALAVPTLRKLEKWYARQVAGEGAAVRSFEIAPGLRFRGLPMPEGAPPMAWGVVDGYLVLTVGEGMAQAVAGGLRGATPGMTGNALFKEVQAKVRVARPCFRTFVDLQRIVKMAEAAGGPDVVRVLKLFGLSDLQALLSETGLEGDSFVARSMLATPGRSGLFGMIGGAPLTADELAVIPGDADLAGAFRVRPQQVYSELLGLIGAIDPQAPERFQAEVVGAVQEATGLDLQKDLLAHLGDSVAVWNSPGQGGLLFSGLTVAVELGDPAAFGKVFGQVMTRLAAMMPEKQRNQWGRLRRGTFLETTRGPGGTKIWYLNTVGDELPFAPAWCISDRHLLVSLFPQMLESSLARKRGPGGGPQVEGSLAEHPAVRGAPNAVAVSFLDAAGVFRVAYPALHLLAQLAVSELQREGVDVTIAALPTAGSIQPHLGTEFSALTVRPDGLLLTRRGSVPIVDPVLSFAMPALAGAPLWMVQQRQMQAVRRARAAAEQARRKQAERDKR